jgi:hypothetical protein
MADIDLKGQLLRMANKSAGHTYDPTTDSLEAIRDLISGVVMDVQGGFYFGVVDGIPGANQFTISGLASYGATSFVGWEAFVFWDDLGGGAAPQGEHLPVTAYTNTGTFTTAAFTAPVDNGDYILIVHPSLYASIATPVPVADVVDNILSRDVVGNKADTANTTAGAASSLMRYVKGLLSLHPVPGADAVTNTNMRDLAGNKADTANYAADATSSLMRYTKALLGTTVIATGTFTTSSATVPADVGKAAIATDYWINCSIMPLTGVCALQPRTISAFTTGTGVFTIDVSTPFTAAPGLVTYVILAGGGGGGAPVVPAIDAVVNATTADVVGNKEDTANTTVGATSSLMRYTKGMIGLMGTPVIVTGTLTTSSATVPADAARVEGANYWKGDVIVPLAGACVYQPALISSFAAGVFTLYGTGWTAAPGLVAYGIYPAAYWKVLEDITSYLLKCKATTIDLNQAAATYDLFTGATQAVIVESLVLRCPDAAAGGALTSISIQTDDTTPTVLITAVQGAVVNLTAEYQLAWTGACYIATGKKIRLTIAGGATGAGYVCNVVASYRPVALGGSLT